MILEQGGGFDGAFVATIHQDDSVARKRDERQFRRRFGGCGRERSHLGAGIRSLFRPTRSFTKVHEAHVRVAAGGLAKQRGFLGAPDRHRRSARDELAKSLELGAAELASGDEPSTATTLMQCPGIERHGVLAGTHKDRARVDHRLSQDLACRPGAGGYVRNNISVGR